MDENVWMEVHRKKSTDGHGWIKMCGGGCMDESARISDV